MKAIVYRDYGSPDVLKYEDIEKPAPRDDEVLIKVRAASVNPLDWHYMRGEPYAFRMSAGIGTPKVTRLGLDVAGSVEAVGRNITRLKPDDEVFGTARGSFAEYVSAPERSLAIKPRNLTFEQAAAVPVGGLTALQALRDEAKVRPGQTVLINGASGGVGTFAVQMAKAFGAEVTGVCSTRNVDLVRTLGALRVVDYTKEDFTIDEQRFDLMLDNVGNRSLAECRRVLKPKGRYIMIGGQSGQWIAPMDRVVRIMVTSWFASQSMSTLLMRPATQEDLATLGELIESGKVMPIVDNRFALSEAADAIRYVETGHARGKVVINIC